LYWRCLSLAESRRGVEIGFEPHRQVQIAGCESAAASRAAGRVCINILNDINWEDIFTYPHPLQSLGPDEWMDAWPVIEE
jgi:hypothetical protein